MNLKNMITAIPMKLFRARNETFPGISMKLSGNRNETIQEYL